MTIDDETIRQLTKIRGYLWLLFVFVVGGFLGLALYIQIR
jgi:hypothetical protein